MVFKKHIMKIVKSHDMFYLLQLAPVFGDI